MTTIDVNPAQDPYGVTSGSNDIFSEHQQSLIPALEGNFLLPATTPGTSSKGDQYWIDQITLKVKN